MFKIEQIKAAHSKVKSGADFPAYIKEIKALGVTHYETCVSDGHTDYHGANNHIVNAPSKYDPLVIAESPDKELFERELNRHQHGQSDYITFIRMCAALGIDRWQIIMGAMTCTYYDKAGNEVLSEKIPQ